MLEMYTTCVNSVHCVKIVYLPTTIVKCIVLYFLYQRLFDNGDH